MNPRGISDAGDFEIDSKRYGKLVIGCKTVKTNGDFVLLERKQVSEDGYTIYHPGENPIIKPTEYWLFRIGGFFYRHDVLKIVNYQYVGKATVDMIKEKYDNRDFCKKGDTIGSYGRAIENDNFCWHVSELNREFL